MARGTPPYARFLTRYLVEEGPRREALALLTDETARVVASFVDDASVVGRLKSPRSTWRKMCRYGIDLDDVHDLLGVRVIVGTDEQCHRALLSGDHHWGPKTTANNPLFRNA